MGKPLIRPKTRPHQSFVYVLQGRDPRTRAERELSYKKKHSHLKGFTFPKLVAKDYYAVGLEPLQNELCWFGDETGPSCHVCN